MIKNRGRGTREKPPFYDKLQGLLGEAKRFGTFASRVLSGLRWLKVASSGLKVA